MFINEFLLFTPFISIPRDGRREAWSKMMIYDGEYFCSQHFTLDSFDNKSQRMRRLQPMAIPTIKSACLSKVMKVSKYYQCLFMETCFLSSQI